ncbi:NUDIX hydrolase [Nocardioides sp. Soil805]|uniref:NUDIX hydrolase n=1 Tax=Nocardioides sp. Soil805 TaxID=1736416 RepID=UPI000702D6D7|nr:NUDIX domain-containing protein [Nocardioides sp. Soil805]KRF36596.1 NTP pyrophosphohydrolase [Nocardioides sp. Soil805]
MPDYIRWIRDRVGHDRIFLNFACCVVSDERGRVLLQLRGDRERRVWGFPGGAIELGESAEQAAVREMREETGLDVAVTDLLGVYTGYEDRYPNGDVAQTIAMVFRAHIEGGALAIDGDETVGLQFHDLERLPHLLNQQHEDIASDVRAGRRGVWR